MTHPRLDADQVKISRKLSIAMSRYTYYKPTNQSRRMRGSRRAASVATLSRTGGRNAGSRPWNSSPMPDVCAGVAPMPGAARFCPSRRRVERSVRKSRVPGATPYRVTIRLAPLTDGQWEAVMDALGERAIFTRPTLGRRDASGYRRGIYGGGRFSLPRPEQRVGDRLLVPGLGQSLQACGRHPLYPRANSLIRIRSSSFACAVAARSRFWPRCVSAGNRVRLWRKSQHRMRSRKRRRHRCRNCWTVSGRWDNLWTISPPPSANRRPRHPTLRRLGPPPFLNENLETRLGPAYDAMTREALRIAFGDGVDTSR